MLVEKQIQGKGCRVKCPVSSAISTLVFEIESLPEAGGYSVHPYIQYTASKSQESSCLHLEEEEVQATQ